MDSSITVWDIPEVNDGDGRVIYRIIENPETTVPKRSASGYYMYQDDLGVISLSMDNDSNFKRHQNMVRAGYYDIRSMEEEFQNKIPPYTLGCIQKGASYLFEYYGKYYKDTYYFKKRITGDYPDSAQLSLLSSDEYGNSEKNGTAGLYRYSQSEYKNSVVALNSEKLRSIDVIYDSNKNHSSGYVYTTALVDLPTDYSGALSSTEAFLLTPYIREYQIFPSSASNILPLTSRIAVSATAAKTSNIEGTITSTISSSSDGNISITTRRKGTAKSILDLYDSVGTLNYGKNSATIKVGLGRIASTMNGYFTVYNIDGSNPYILLPLYLEDEVQRMAAATSGDDSGYLSYVVQIDGVAFDLVEDGGSLYLERESDSRRFTLYSVAEASERFSWTMSMDGLEEKDVHVLQLYIEGITKTRLTDKQILGRLDIAEVVETDPITGEKKIDSESFRTVMPYEYDSGVCSGLLSDSNFALASDFEDVTISSAKSLKKYLAELAADDNAATYSAIFVPASSKSSTGTIYYISKSTLVNIEDTSEVISVFDVYYDDFQYTKSDSDEYTGTKRITYSSKETKIYFLDDIALDIYTANDTYYIGRKNALEEKIYYKNKKAAVKSLLMKAINNPYGTIDMTDMMADANHFDEARVFAGGLYSFVSNDRAHTAADATSVRDLNSISSLEDSTSIYQYQDNSTDSAAEDISLYEANGSMTAEELTALNEFSGAARLLKYKEYPTYQQYLNALKASATTRDALEATTDSEYQNIDVEKYYQSGEYKYYKDLEQTYSPRVIYRKDFATALTATVYKYATSNRNTPASGISTDDTHKNYAKTMELIKSKVISASNAKSKQGASTKKMKLADADHGDVEALITALFNGATKLK